MKKSHASIAIFALIIVAAGCSIHLQGVRNGDPHTKYVVNFPKYTPLKTDKDAETKFIAALKNASWHREIAFSSPKSGVDPDPYDNPHHTPPPIPPSIPFTVTPVCKPGTIQVTQRVGYNKGQEKVIKDLLDGIQD